MLNDKVVLWLLFFEKGIRLNDKVSCLEKERKRFLVFLMVKIVLLWFFIEYDYTMSISMAQH